MAPFIKQTLELPPLADGPHTELIYVNAEYIIKAAYDTKDGVLVMHLEGDSRVTLEGEDAKAALEVLRKL